MATAYGVNSAKYLDPVVTPANKQPVGGGDQAGRVSVIYDQFVIPAAGAGAANGDILVMGRLLKNQRIIGGTLAWGALGTSVTLKWGDDGDDDRIRAAAAAATAGQGGITEIAGHGFVMDADRNVLVTIGGATPTAGILIKSMILVVHV